MSDNAHNQTINISSNRIDISLPVLNRQILCIWPPHGLYLDYYTRIFAWLSEAL